MLMTWWVSPKNAGTVTRQDEVPAGLKSLLKAGFSSLDRIPEMFVLFVFCSDRGLNKAIGKHSLFNPLSIAPTT